jgi:hypothetical protein
MTNGVLGGLYPSDQRHVKVSLEVLPRLVFAVVLVKGEQGRQAGFKPLKFTERPFSARSAPSIFDSCGSPLSAPDSAAAR